MFSAIRDAMDTDVDDIMDRQRQFQHVQEETFSGLTVDQRRKFYRMIDIPNTSWQFVCRMVNCLNDDKQQQQFPWEGEKFIFNVNTNQFIWEFRGHEVGKIAQMKMLEQDLNLVRFRDSLLSAIFKMSELNDNYEKFLMENPLDEELQNYFNNPIPENKEKGPRFFNYLLIDSGLVKNKFDQNCTPKDCTFAHFVRSIFYIGKGTRQRPMDHLHNTFKAGMNSSNRFNCSYKKERIREIWDNGEGVIILRCFEWVFDHESMAREALMLKARSIYNWKIPRDMEDLKWKNKPSCYDLVNKQDEKFDALGWNNEKNEKIGTLLLVRAYAIFRNELNRPIKQSDLEKDSTVPEPEYAPLQNTLPPIGYCAVCGQDFTQTDVLHSDGNFTYHDVCFKCNYCKCSLFNLEFFYYPSKNHLFPDKNVYLILCKHDNDLWNDQGSGSQHQQQPHQSATVVRVNRDSRKNGKWQID